MWVSVPGCLHALVHADVSEEVLKCCFTSTETVVLLGTGAQDVHLDLPAAPEL